MKHLLLLTGFSLSLAAGSAMAQDTPPPPPAPPVASDAMAPPPPPPAGPRGPEEAMRGGKGPHGPEGHRPPPPPPSKAAHYRIETDDVKIDLKCADDEPAKACADLLMSTIDKLGIARD